MKKLALVVAAASAVAASLGTIGTAAAQVYPNKPVRLIVPYPAAGGADIVARLLGQSLLERLGQPFIIENRPGAASNIGTEAALRATPDGYTLLLVTVANTINATLYERLNFNLIRDITPVASTDRVPNLLEVNPSVPAKTVPEFIAYAKANPGKINMASAGNGTSQHVAGELFKMMAGISMTHVPYRGGAPALTVLAARCRPCSTSRRHRWSTSGPANCARWQWPPRHAWRRCRTSRPWLITYLATRRAPFMASAHPGARRPKLSTSSTRRSIRF